MNFKKRSVTYIFLIGSIKQYEYVIIKLIKIIHSESKRTLNDKQNAALDASSLIKSPVKLINSP